MGGQKEAIYQTQPYRGLVSLDPQGGQPVQSVMSLIVLCCQLMVHASDGATEPHPLGRSLRDPWGVVREADESIQVPSENKASPSVGPSFSDFKASYHSELDLANLGQSSIAEHFRLAEKEWDQFRPTQWMWEEGTILYGDPRMFAESRELSSSGIRVRGWWAGGLAVALAGILILLWILRQHGSHLREKTAP